jgi:hypothetical protein
MYTFHPDNSVGRDLGWYGEGHVFGPCLKMTKIIDGLGLNRDIGFDLDPHSAG